MPRTMRQPCWRKDAGRRSAVRGAMIALCRGAKIPLATGGRFRRGGGRDAAAHVWVEVLVGDRWIPYDPVNGYEKELPTNFVPARRGDDQVVVARRHAGS